MKFVFWDEQIFVLITTSHHAKSGTVNSIFSQIKVKVEINTENILNAIHIKTNSLLIRQESLIFKENLLLGVFSVTLKY